MIDGHPAAGADESEQPSVVTWLGALAAFLLLGFAAPLLLVTGAGTEPRAPEALWVLWVLGAIIAARIAALWLRPRARLMSMAFYVFTYVFIVLSGLAQVATETYPLDNRNYAPSPVVATAVMLLLGCVAHEVAYSLSLARRPRSPAPDTRRIGTGGVYFLALLSLAVVAVTISRSGIEPFFDSREAANAVAFGDQAGIRVYEVDSKAAGLLWLRAIHMIPFVALYVLLFALRRKILPVTWANTLIALLLAIANFVVNNPVSNSRLWSGIVIFALASLFIDMRKDRHVRAAMASLLAAFVLAFPYADAFRRSVTEAQQFMSPLRVLASDGSFSAFQTAVNGILYVDQNGFSRGEQLLGSLFTLVPRALWSGKPVDTGALIDPRYNRASTLWTEFHVDFGVVGVVVGLALVGILARILDEWFRSGRPTVIVYLVPVLAPFYIFLLRGSLSAAVGTVVPLLALLLVPLLGGRGRERERETSLHQRQGASSHVRARSEMTGRG